MQRQGSLAMVSPCSSSSKQMEHSPESLDRMSSERGKRHKSLNRGLVLPAKRANRLFNLWYLTTCFCPFTCSVQTGCSPFALLRLIQQQLMIFTHISSHDESYCQHLRQRSNLTVWRLKFFTCYMQARKWLIKKKKNFSLFLWDTCVVLRVIKYILPQEYARFAHGVRKRQILHAFHRKCAATQTCPHLWGEWHVFLSHRCFQLHHSRFAT